MCGVCVLVRDANQWIILWMSTLLLSIRTAIFMVLYRLIILHNCDWCLDDIGFTINLQPFRSIINTKYNYILLAMVFTMRVGSDVVVIEDHRYIIFLSIFSACLLFCTFPSWYFIGCFQRDCFAVSWWRVSKQSDRATFQWDTGEIDFVDSTDSQFWN